MALEAEAESEVESARGHPLPPCETTINCRWICLFRRSFVWVLFPVSSRSRGKTDRKKKPNK